MTTTTEAFTGYFDDSGHPDDQPFVIVAGHIATVEQWLILEREWNETMGTDSDGKPRIFHTAEMPERERAVILPKLISIITRRVRKQFSITIRMDEYLRVNEVYALEEFLGKPYALAGRSICVMIHAWGEQYNQKKLPLKTVFEDGTKHKGDLMDVMNRDNDCPNPIFESKKDVVALQTADLLAWELLQSQKKDGYYRREFIPLLKHPNDFNEYREADLTSTCEAFGVPLRSNMPQGTKIFFTSSPKKFRYRQLTKPKFGTDEK